MIMPCRALIATALLFFITVVHGAIAADMECHGKASHWRDIAYSTGSMSRYKDLRNCIAWTAYQFELPEELLYAMLDVERGPVNGRCRTNKNGTQDCGPAQINDVRISELSAFNLTKNDIKSKPCHNLWAMGYLLRKEIEKAGGRIWRGVGNYHYHYSVNPSIHNRYIKKVKNSWNKLNRKVEVYCSEK
ncbi:MAG: lytic transglycosylase domain-containing protein [Succinivibrio sp.]